MAGASAHYDASTRARAGISRRTPLQRFHNEAKRALLAEHAEGAVRLLDLACGRGGDIHKWRALGIRHVVGLDVSKESVDEARERFTKTRDGHSPLTCAFHQADVREGWRGDRPFDAVTCMFALHYFFESEAAAHAIMRTISHNLRPGGVFLGIVPDGRAVMECIKHGPFDNGVMRVTALWQGPPACFGSAYTCAITDTVTEASTVPEYLVFDSVLTPLAAAYGLEPVPVRSPLFERVPGAAAFHRLRPPYGEPRSTCTEMYAAFAFRKQVQKKSVRTLP